MGSGEHYRSLPVNLSDDEKEQRTQDLIRRLDVVEDIEEKRKATNDEYKSQIKRELVNISTLRRELKQGYTMEEVKCEDNVDWGNGVVITRRTDNYEVVSEREITETERQMRLDDQAEAELEEAESEPVTTEEQIEEDLQNQPQKKIFTKDKSGEGDEGHHDT
jgi:hypothetical protein